jgi:hypothetical protein
MKTSIFTSAFLFINFFIFGQCPTSQTISTDSNCINVTWTVDPIPIPMILIVGGRTFDLVANSGPLTHIYRNGFCPSPVTQSGFSGTMIIGSRTCTYANGVLPLNFISYKASFTNETLSLEWSTTNEVNVASFKIEMSKDGENWTSSDLEINILNQRSTSKEYKAILQNVTTQPNYLRIVGVDLDGTETKTKIFSPNIVIANDISIAPNPSLGDIITYSCFGCSTKGSTLYFNTMDGKTVKSFTNKFNGDMLDVSDLGQGVYFIRVNDAVAQPIVIKFIKR